MSLVDDGGSSSDDRKTHIHRIYKDDDPDSGMWIDVERIDKLTYTSGTGFAQQTKAWIFNWSGFNPDSDTVTKKKIQDPNDNTDPDDPAAAVIKVPIHDQIEVSQGSGAQQQEYTHFFANGLSTSRQTHSRRVYHYDVPDDQLDENKNPPSDPQDYLNALGDKDPSQYLEVEVLDSFTTSENENRDSHGQLKPSAWQEKTWLVNSTGALLQDRDGDTSNDYATKNPADGIVDPPWRLDPLQNIVNVGFGDEYRLVASRSGQHGAPQWGLSFTTPKTFFTSSEVNKKQLPIPAFGSGISLPTETRSPNGIAGGGPNIINEHPVTLTGDSLQVAPPNYATDYRGYTALTMSTFQEQPDGEFVAVHGTRTIYFNYKGETISRIPPPPTTAVLKGLALAADEDGTVYVRSGAVYPGADAKNPLEGITKYSRDGSVIWNSNPTQDANFSVRCANYDSETKLITFVDNLDRIHSWDLDGSEVSVIDLPDRYVIADVSRKGKIYALALDGGGIAAFSPTGDKLWETFPDGTFGVGSAMAFGEDWVITVESGNSSGSSDRESTDVGVRGEPDFDIKTVISTTGSFDFQMGVYDANTGSAVKSEFWATGSSDETLTIYTNDTVDPVQELNIGSYNALSFGRSSYFP